MSENAALSAEQQAPGALVRELLQAGIAGLASKASRVVDDLSDKLESAAEDAGPMAQAGMAAVEAKSAGRSPVWAALKAGWSAASTEVRIATTLVLLLMIVLAPLALLGLLLTLLILWIREAVSG
jgi:hypothetical protein